MTDELLEALRKADSSIDVASLTTLQSAFTEIQQPRTDFELKHFVVDQHEGDPQRYAQCVLEIQTKFNNIRRALINKRKINYEIDSADISNPLVQFDVEGKRIDLEEQDLALLGAVREFQALYKLFLSFEKKFTREEINAAQPEYWVKRLTRQANHDLLANGRVGVGNIDALRMIGRAPVPALDHIRDVEKRALSVGDIKILFCIATEKKADKGLPCLEGLEIPAGIQYKIFNVFGRKVDDAYNEGVRQTLEDGADFMFTVEDDTFPPPDALIRLLAHARNGADAIGAWYPKRQVAYEGAPIAIGPDGKRMALPADGKVHEVFALPMGCTLIRANLFLKTDFPWFATTDHLTQDTFFSQKLRDIGVTPLCDTSIRCKHIDRDTHQVYE